MHWDGSELQTADAKIASSRSSSSPPGAATCTCATSSPYLTIAEAAEIARVSPKRLRNLMSAGILREGHHFTRPKGLAPRVKREPFMRWLDGVCAVEDEIPMARKLHHRRSPQICDGGRA